MSKFHPASQAPHPNWLIRISPSADKREGSKSFVDCIQAAISAVLEIFMGSWQSYEHWITSKSGEFPLRDY